MRMDQQRTRVQTNILTDGATAAAIVRFERASAGSLPPALQPGLFDPGIQASREVLRVSPAINLPMRFPSWMVTIQTPINANNINAGNGNS
jgi:hypothetical protein